METESPTVLLIEDHEDTRRMLALLFEEWGYEAAIAPTATEGLKHLLERHFNLIVLDNWLPDLDGVELCRQVRAVDRQTPIIFYSASGMGSEDREALDSGANAFVSKSGSLGELREAMAAQLKKTNGKTFKPL
jgi:two-component system, OmpR family, KDP operon response regulator KdpE